MGPNTAAAQSNASETQPAELESLVRQMAETLLKSRRRASVSLPSFPPATLFWPAAYSAGLMLSFLFIHTHLMQPVQDATLYTYYSVDAIRQKVWETDWITPAILLTFLFGTFYLRSIWRSKHTYLSKAEHSHFYKAVLTGQLGLVRIAIESAEHAATLDYYGARLHALINRWRDDADLPAVQALKNEILEIDEQDIVHSFVPIVWCETTLPLLGFLGTVVGIGAAIGSISEAIKILLRSAAESGGSQLDILFNRGFENMALAFDTTFFGLFFLLCLGLFHIYVRRALAIRLDNARRFYSLALTQLPQGSGNLMKGLIERVTAVEGTLGIIDNNSKAGLKGVNDRVEAVERTLRTINEESTAYKERVEGLVDHVIMEVPEFAGIRKALMKPVVEFTEIEAGPAQEFQRFLGGELSEGWTLNALGITGGSEAGGMVSVSSRSKEETYKRPYRSSPSGQAGECLPQNSDSSSKSKQETWIATFGTSLNQNNRIFGSSTSLISILPAESLDAFLGVAHGEHGIELWSGVLPTGGVSKSQASMTRLPYTVMPHLRPLFFGPANVLVPVQAGGNLDIYTVHFGPTPRPTKSIELTTGLEWRYWDANYTAETLVVAGCSSKSGCRLEFMSVSHEKGTDSVQIRPTGTVHLPEVTDITRVQTIGAAPQCVFTDAEGHLYYIDESRNEPIALKHNDLPLDIKEIFFNGKGWLAILSNDKLSMWKCRRGGFIYPYEGKSLSVSALDPNSYCVSAEGQRLYSCSKTLIVRWSFPKSIRDQK